MLRIYNSLGKKIEIFKPANREVVNIFTCGPSVYQRVHIGNFRTFLFEDILIRYLEYSGYKVQRGMNFTDIEDKAIVEADKRDTTVRVLTEKNIRLFLKEMKLLRMKIPVYLPKASDHVNNAADIIDRLLKKRVAYWHGGNVYFDPLMFPGFGKIFGLDMSRWPRKRRRFHKDTYPGIQWNLGDFILWHGYKEGEKSYWETKIGKGRPSWNIQDPSVIRGYFDEPLSIYCGGIDNLYRHHDYTLAILESIRPYPMSLFWLHCHHLNVEGRKMSKNKGNIYYTETILKQGYSVAELRFFLIYNHYRSPVNYADDLMHSTAGKLRSLRQIVVKLRHKAGKERAVESVLPRKVQRLFKENMDDDLNVKAAFDEVYNALSDIVPSDLRREEAAGTVKVLRDVDEVLQVIF